MKAAASVSTDIHVVMGVSASGKSTVGRLLAQARGATYLDGDDFHPPENVIREFPQFPVTRSYDELRREIDLAFAAG